MMKTMIWLLAAAAFTAATPAAATVVATTTTYDFSGRCTDCSGYGIGRLILRNYTAGQSITSDNFVSFRYDGSNLYNAFTITSPTSINGSIASDTAPGFAALSLIDRTNYFKTQTSGNWSLGKTSSLASDFGTADTFTPAIAAVPEPATWALMLAGFGLTGAALRRRRVRFARVVA